MVPTKDPEQRKRPLVPILIATIVLLVFLVIGLVVAVVIVGRKSSSSKTEDAPSSSPYHQTLLQNLDAQNDISAKLLAAFVPTNIRDNLRWVAEKVHVAGTQEQNELMHKIAAQYRAYGFDDVQTPSYTVLLNYPDYDRPNTVDVLESSATWTQLSDGKAEAVGPPEAREQQNDSRMFVWWNGYAGNGTVTGQIVYANYGTLDDYKNLDRDGVNLTGKIVFCRYGSVWRGAKVFEAENRGAIGVIIFIDPADNAYLEINNLTFADNLNMPPSGAQRGSLAQTDGDPETPFFPSKDFTYRTENEQSLRNAHVLPSVPVMPMGYRDAIKIMARLDGPEVKPEWRGRMNVTYRSSGSATFRLTVRSTCEHRTITNVVATMRGIDEPDRIVVFGNHADAWVKGAIDPNSGTSTLLEMGRVLASVVNETGWRPRRTIVFCHWDAEEFGLIGSTEFVEEYLRLLQTRAVAYINIDNMSGNTTVSTMAVPVAYRILVDAAAKCGLFMILIQSPSVNEQNANRKTVLDSWSYYSPGGPMGLPGISLPGSGSDFSRFITYAGIPVIDIHFTNPSSMHAGYNIYHSMYETPWTVENLMTTDFQAFTACGQMLLEVGRNLADSLIIPFNVSDYGLMLSEFVNNMDRQLNATNGLIDALGNANYTTYLANVRDAIGRFQTAADNLQQYVTAANKGTLSVTVRQAEMLNARLVALERVFITDQGIYPERNFYRHLVFTSSQYDAYAGVTFAVIMDPATDWQNAAGDLPQAMHWLETIRIGFTKVQYAIESAILLLNTDGFND